MKKESPVVLIIRDGWGANHNASHDAFNAVKLANTPCSDELSEVWPRTEITACGLDVGLPEGIMGNSEVGHQNIGAGRIVNQEIVRINKGFSDGIFREKKVAKDMLSYIREHNGRLHLMGLISDGGVHSTLDHLYSLLDWAKDSGINEVYIHAITDGRDTAPKGALAFIEAIEAKCSSIALGKIATVCGRFWAMDRDQRWDRVRQAYECFTGRATSSFNSASEAIRHYYENPISETQQGDEFVLPAQVLKQGAIKDLDAVIFFNFRGDRPREITQAFIEDNFLFFEREKKLSLFYATMSEYKEGLCEHVLFTKPERMKDTLGSYLAERGVSQFRCAETEKYPHVTFFFNDYREQPFRREHRGLVDSPKDVETYDQKPEMSSGGVMQSARDAILSQKYGLIVVNFANADMVGHTGDLNAVIKAIETVDMHLCSLLGAIDLVDGKAIVTADHGNADQMWDTAIDSKHTRHTLNPVELIVYGKGCEEYRLHESGRLADVAPTVLDLMNIPQPKAMTGKSLIV